MLAFSSFLSAYSQFFDETGGLQLRRSGEPRAGRARDWGDNLIAAGLESSAASDVRRPCRVDSVLSRRVLSSDFT